MTLRSTWLLRLPLINYNVINIPLISTLGLSLTPGILFRPHEQEIYFFPLLSTRGDKGVLVFNELENSFLVNSNYFSATSNCRVLAVVFLISKI